MSSIPQHDALQNEGDGASGAMQGCVELRREAASTPDTLSRACPYGNVAPLPPGEASPEPVGQRDLGIHSEPAHFQKDSGLGSAPDRPCDNKQGTESQQERFPSLLKAGMEIQSTEQIYKCLV